MEPNMQISAGGREVHRVPPSSPATEDCNNPQTEDSHKANPLPETHPNGTPRNPTHPKGTHKVPHQKASHPTKTHHRSSKEAHHNVTHQTPPNETHHNGTHQRPPNETHHNGAHHRPPNETHHNGACHRPPNETHHNATYHRPPNQPHHNATHHRPSNETHPNVTHRPPTETHDRTHRPPTETTHHDSTNHANRTNHTEPLTLSQNTHRPPTETTHHDRTNHTNRTNHTEPLSLKKPHPTTSKEPTVLYLNPHLKGPDQALDNTIKHITKHINTTTGNSTNVLSIQTEGTTNKDKLTVFQSLLETNQIQKLEKPLLWCPSCKLYDEHSLQIPSNSTSTYFTVPLPLSINQPIFNLFTVDPLIDITTPISLTLWTTSPWSLPLNQGIALNPNAHYSMILHHQQAFIVIQSQTQNLSNLIIENSTNRANLTISPPNPSVGVTGRLIWDCFSTLQWTVMFLGQPTRLVLSGEVSKSLGTGIVHLVPSCSELDFNIGKSCGLSTECHLNDNGEYTMSARMKEITGRSFDDSDSLIVDHLKSINQLISVQMIQQTKPCCVRCRGSVFLRSTSQWYWKHTGSMMDHLKEAYQKASFLPKRTQKPLSNALLKTHFLISNCHSVEGEVEVCGECKIGQPKATGKCGNCMREKDLLSFHPLFGVYVRLLQQYTAQCHYIHIESYNYHWSTSRIIFLVEAYVKDKLLKPENSAERVKQVKHSQGQLSTSHSIVTYSFPVSYHESIMKDEALWRLYCVRCLGDDLEEYPNVNLLLSTQYETIRAFFDKLSQTYGNVTSNEENVVGGDSLIVFVYHSLLKTRSRIIKMLQELDIKGALQATLDWMKLSYTVTLPILNELDTALTASIMHLVADTARYLILPILPQLTQKYQWNIKHSIQLTDNPEEPPLSKETKQQHDALEKLKELVEKEKRRVNPTQNHLLLLEMDMSSCRDAYFIFKLFSSSLEWPKAWKYYFGVSSCDVVFRGDSGEVLPIGISSNSTNGTSLLSPTAPPTPTPPTPTPTPSTPTPTPSESKKFSKNMKQAVTITLNQL